MEQTPNVNYQEVHNQSQPEVPQSHTSPLIVEKKRKPHTFFQSLIGLAIAVLFVLLYFYSFQLIFEGQKSSPAQYQKNYQACYETNGDNIHVKTECLSEGGVWNENPDGKSSGSVLVNGQEIQIMGRCDMSQKVQECMRKASASNPYASYGNSDTYQNNKYLGALIFGIVLIVLSMFIRGVLALSIGLSLGGVVMLVSGVFHFWSDINGLLRVIILAAGLAVIIFIAVKKLKSE